MHKGAPIIDRVTPAGKGSAWVWVIAGGARISKLPGSVAADCGAVEGAAFTVGMAAKAESLSRIWNAERDGVRLLRTRGRSKAELRSRLIARGHAARDADAALERLAKAGLQSDETLATDRIAKFERTGGASRKLLTADLERAGVDEATAKKVVNTHASESETETARQVAAFAAAKLPDRLTPEVAVKKLLGTLARRGFDEEAAAEAVASAYPPGRDLLSGR